MLAEVVLNLLANLGNLTASNNACEKIELENG
jgi:hypothetical protein